MNKEKNQRFFSPSIFPKSRKGELTTQQIITIIIIIISFVVLLFFLFRLNPGETSSKQICYNSVALISKGRGLIGSLDCKTNYLCMSGGDSCANFNPTTTVKVDVAKKEEILKTIADEMSDCWWMFGEGKVDYASGFLEKSPNCGICSRIKFDKKIQDSIKEVTYPELYDYMKTHQSTHDSSQSYLKYLYGVNGFDSSNAPVKNLDSAPISTGGDYIIITGIDPQQPYLWGDKSLPVHILRPDESTSKVGCEIFGITKA